MMKTEFHKIGEFLEGTFPEIVKRCANGSCRVVFSTYNSVTGMRNGSTIEAPGLSIVVKSGNAVVPMFPLMIAFTAHEEGNFGLADEAWDEARHSARKAQDALTHEIVRDEVHDVQYLLVMYVGRRAYEEVLAGVRAVRARLPESTIIMVSCDCNTPDDFRGLHGIADHIAITPECGGEDTMRTVMNLLEAHWREMRA